VLPQYCHEDMAYALGNSGTYFSTPDKSAGTLKEDTCMEQAQAL
jgi:hypothetical protein